MAKVAILDTTLTAIALPDPIDQGDEAPLRVDPFGALWTRPHIVAGAEAIASAAYTASANTAAITVPDGCSKVNVFISITAVGGDADETLDIEIEWSPDAGTTWHTVEGAADTFDQMTQPLGTQNVAKQFTVLAPTYRLALVIAGTTPTFTFVVDQVGVYA